MRAPVVGPRDRERENELVEQATDQEREWESLPPPDRDTDEDDRQDEVADGTEHERVAERVHRRDQNALDERMAGRVMECLALARRCDEFGVDGVP